MGIRVEHGKPSTVIKAARRAGEVRAGKEIAKQAMVNAARLQERQMAQEYDMALKKQDMAIDLQMNERAKLWEIDKMQLRSQMDFQREEQERQRKLDSADNALQQIDKEVLAGRMTEEEARPLKLKYEMNKIGVDVPTSLLPTGDDEERYGVQPYWMRGRDAPEGTPERQLYDAKMAQTISGERKGTVPYYLDPEWLRDNRDIAMQVLDSKGVILEEEEIDALISGAEPTELPLGNKSLDVGVRGSTPIGDGRVRVISPEGQTGTILESELSEYVDKGFEVVGEAPGEPTETPLPETSEDVIGRLEAGKAKFRKPSLRTFATMSPLRALMERRKAKKIVR